MRGLHLPGGLPFAVARELDKVAFKVFGSRRGPPATVALRDGRLEINPVTRAARHLRHVMPIP